MSIDDSNALDLVGIDKITGEVVLSIIDAMDWSDEHSHLYKLQEKINLYLAVLESGEIFKVYPDTKDKRFVISIVFKYTLPVPAEAFLKKVSVVIVNAGFRLKWEVSYLN